MSQVYNRQIASDTKLALIEDEIAPVIEPDTKDQP